MIIVCPFKPLSASSYKRCQRRASAAFPSSIADLVKDVNMVILTCDMADSVLKYVIEGITNITGATNILLNTSGRIDIVALNKAVTYIREQAGENVNIFWGTVSGEDAPQEIVVTVIATGMNQAKKLLSSVFPNTLTR